MLPLGSLVALEEASSEDDDGSALLVGAGLLDVPGAGPELVLPTVEFVGAGGLTEGVGGLTEGVVVEPADGPGTGPGVDDVTGVTVELPVGADGDSVSAGPVEQPTVTATASDGKSEGAIKR